MDHLACPGKHMTGLGPGMAADRESLVIINFVIFEPGGL